LNVVCQNRTGFNVKVDMVTVEERALTWARGDNEVRSHTETSLQRKGGRP